jgi:hypothetical protein
MWPKRKPKNRRLEREQVLDVRLRTKEVRAARLKLAGTALAVAVGAGIGLFLIWRTGEWSLNALVLTNDAFAIKRLVIETDGILPVEQLQRWAGVKKGDNLLALDLARVKRDLELVSLIESVAVERVLPNTLRVRVMEREPVAQVKMPQLTRGGVEFVRYHFDASGYVMLVKEHAPGLAPGAQAEDTLPVLSGINGTDLTPGRAANSPTVQAALRLITEFDDSPMAGLVDVERIEVSNPGWLQVTTGQRSQVTFSLDRLDQQLRRWRLVHDYGRRIGRAILTLDLSVTNNSPVLWLDASAVPATQMKARPPSRNKKKHV